VSDEQGIQIRVVWGWEHPTAPVRQFHLCVIQDGVDAGLPAFNLTLENGEEVNLVMPEESARRFYLGVVAAFGALVERTNRRAAIFDELEAQRKPKLVTLDDVRKPRRP